MRRAGSEAYGTRAEIKNLNSVRSLGRALEYEVRRQVGRLEAGEPVVQETRHWNEDEGRTSSMRSKEEAYDYRYFPEPDLVPLAPSEDWLSGVRAGLPVLPADRRAALADATGVSPTDPAVATVVHQGLDALVTEAVAAGADGRLALNRAANELAHRAVPDAAAFATVLKMEADGKLSATQAKAVLAELVASGGEPEDIARAKGFEALEGDVVAAAVDAAIAANPGEWERYAGGEAKLAGFFVGKVMAATSGKADGKAVTALLRQRAGL
jgi:aspartyl-tRNA(Asn)/glutamyl-tRNA(Gln) amidotransferase subunit B